MEKELKKKDDTKPMKALLLVQVFTCKLSTKKLSKTLYQGTLTKHYKGTDQDTFKVLRHYTGIYIKSVPTAIMSYLLTL